MSKRSAAVERTRRRIVEATMELHNRQGALATSWEQIAELADVSPATVYRHFPTMDELLPACGALSFENLDLPSDERFGERLDGVEEPAARIGVLVDELFSIYERGQRTFWAVRRDRASLPNLQEAHEQIEQRLEAITAIALGPLRLDPDRLPVVRALTDYDSWSALRAQGLRGRAAEEATVALLVCWLGIEADGERP